MAVQGLGATEETAGPVRLRLGRWRSLSLILAVGALLSCAAFLAAEHQEKRRIQDILEFRAQWRAQDMQAKITDAADPIEAIANFVQSSDRIDPVQFRRFADSVQAGDRTRVIGWAPWVTPQSRGEVETMVEAEGLGPLVIIERTADGTVGPAGERPAYLPLWLEVLPLPNNSPRGFDLLSEPNRRGIILPAIDSARPVASPPLRPLVGSQERTCYLMIWPIYRGAAPATIAERRAALRGIVIANIDFESLLEGAVRDTPDIIESIEFHIDGAASAADDVSARYDPARRQFTMISAGQAGRLAQPRVRFATERHFEVLGRQWTITSTFGPDVAAGLRSSVPWMWLAACLMLTLLTAAYFDRERLTRLQAEDLVELRTQELTATASILDREAADRERVEIALQHHARLLSKTLEATPLAIIHLGPQREVLVWNRGAEAMFGYAAAHMIGRPLPAITTGERDDLDALFDRLRRGEEVDGLQLERHHKDGKMLRVKLSAEPVFEGLTFQGVVMAIEDLTQRHTLEEQLRQSQKMEAIGQLTGGMAHDFNNLLLVILGNLGLLAEFLPAEDQDSQTCCREAREAALRGAALIRSLLAFARRQPLRPEEIDINALILEQMVLLRHTLGEQIEIVTHLGDPLWPVLADAAQLETALINLATNARDAMAKGGRLTISTRNQRLDRDYVSAYPEAALGDHAVIEVSDTGIGMPPEVIRRIFEPFYSTKERGAGTGLGLSMVFGFMKQSGGHINVYSELGRGTTFRLFLPRAPASAADAEPAGEMDVPMGHGERILLVEDNDAIRRLASRQLTQLGYRVQAVGNVAEALEHFAEGHQVDLLFTDIVMPGRVDGLDLAALVRERWPTIKILLTSGFPDHDDSDFARFGPLLSKPFQREELARALHACLVGDEG